jgi:hypothetical protein
MDIQGDSEGKVNIFGDNSRIVVSSCDRAFNCEWLTRSFFFGGGGNSCPNSARFWLVGMYEVEIYKIKANT